MNRAEQNVEYVQVYEPDRVQLAELINAAKGLNRTMAQFAEMCGISAPTLSRISNGKIIRALPEETIRKIYEHKDNNLDASLDTFMRANGMQPKTTYDRMMTYGVPSVNRHRQIIRERSMKDIITYELFARGIAIKMVPRAVIRDAINNKYGMYRKSTFVLYLPESKQERFWNFYIIATGHEEELKEDDEEFRMRMIMDRCASIFLFDAWDPQILVDEKTSFVFCEKELYKRFITNLKSVKLNTTMSVILVDVLGKRVVEEYWLSSKSQDKPNSIFEIEFDDRNDWYDEPLGINRYEEDRK